MNLYNNYKCNFARFYDYLIVVFLYFIDLFLFSNFVKFNTMITVSYILASRKKFKFYMIFAISFLSSFNKMQSIFLLLSSFMSIFFKRAMISNELLKFIFDTTLIFIQYFCSNDIGSQKYMIGFFANLLFYVFFLHVFNRKRKKLI
ncbi:hypothetical protein Gromo_00346 [Candidatus Gromoviella agglomerans]|nr:hypothetical protein Gromo_00346 [Candidatus Gromoviella agglomerans]